MEEVGALRQGLAEFRHTARGLSGDDEGTGTQRLRLATEQRDVLFICHGIGLLIKMSARWGTQPIRLHKCCGADGGF